MTLLQARKLLKEVPDSRYVNIEVNIRCARHREDEIEYTLTLNVGERPGRWIDHTSHDLAAAVNHILAEVGVISATVEQVSQQMQELESQQ